MDPVLNPFRPGAGRRPPVLAGRERILSNFDVVVRRAEEFGEGDRSWVINGLRGVGKTVLLNELMSQANARKWIVAKVEASASTPLRKILATELAKAAGYALLMRREKMAAHAGSAAGAWAWRRGRTAVEREGLVQAEAGSRA